MRNQLEAIQILLILILITLLGAWQIIGISLIVIVVILLVGVILYYGLIKLLPILTNWLKNRKNQKNIKKETQESLKPALIIIASIFIAFLILSGGSSATKNKENNIQGETLLQKAERLGIQPAHQNHKYTLINITNVRSCASIDCTVVGQYPANTEFEFPNSLLGLPKWIEISWVDNSGKTQYGYIHKSTLQVK